MDLVQGATDVIDKLGVEVAILVALGFALWYIMKKLLDWFQNSVIKRMDDQAEMVGGKLDYQTEMTVKLIKKIEGLNISIVRHTTFNQTMAGVRLAKEQRRSTDSMGE